MIPYEIDPSLHGGEPQPAVLDDGFAPPRTLEPAAEAAAETAAPTADPADQAITS
jgi:hypothetical protein